MRRGTLVVGLVVVLALLSSGAQAAPGTVSTEVRVGPLVVGTFGVPAANVQPHVPAGFAVRSCFGGSEADVAVLVTEETFLDLRKVPAEPSRQVTIMTCVDPPAHLVRADASEPHFFVLGQWSESDALRTFVRHRGGELGDATVSIEPVPGGVAIDARDADGNVLVAGNLATPDVPTPPLADCAPHSQTGRVLSVTKSGFDALDFDKVESTCLGSGELHWDTASPLTTFVGPSPRTPIAANSHVDQATYTFRPLAA